MLNVLPAVESNLKVKVISAKEKKRDRNTIWGVTGKMDLPSTKMGVGNIRGSALESLFYCLLVNTATVLAVEYLESGVQEETGLEVEM